MIHMKFGVPMQKEMPMTTDGLKSKPEVALQYGASLFFHTGSSNNSVVAWDIFTKSVRPTPRDPDLRTTALSNWNRYRPIMINHGRSEIKRMNKETYHLYAD